MSITTEVACPDSLKGKEFEQHIVSCNTRLKKKGLAHIGRYGVQATVEGYNPDGTVKARLMSSLPDFEGVFGPNARQTIFDAKVCSQASFQTSKFRESKGKERQLRHLCERAEFGVVSFFLIHWNLRELKTKTEDPITYAFPVHTHHPFWQRFYVGETKTLNRDHCEEYAVKVPWSTIGMERSPRPDLMHAILGVAAKLEAIRPPKNPW